MKKIKLKKYISFIEEIKKIPGIYLDGENFCVRVRNEYRDEHDYRHIDDEKFIVGNIYSQTINLSCLTQGYPLSSNTDNLDLFLSNLETLNGNFEHFKFKNNYIYRNRNIYIYGKKVSNCYEYDDFWSFDLFILTNEKILKHKDYIFLLSDESFLNCYKGREYMRVNDIDTMLLK